MKNSLLVCIFLSVFSVTAAAQKAVEQKEISLVRTMPDLPSPYKMKDWKAITAGQDKLLYDFEAKGRWLPLIWWDDSQVNFPIRSFGLPSYVGSRTHETRGNNYESLAVLGSVVGASLTGINKSGQQGYDFVTMCTQFFNKQNGINLVLNNVNGRTGKSFWYEIWPGMTFNMLADLYPSNKELGRLMKTNAESWLAAVNGLSKGREYPDFNFTAYDFAAGQGYYNGRWHEPDAAAGLAWLQFTAWKRTGEAKFLNASRSCMEYLQQRPAKEGPYYEIMLPFGAYLAVRMNAELGTSYDEMKLLNWCFDGNNSDRNGWGVISERWGNYDVHGLVGQKKAEQYAFAMNSYAQAAALLPVVKYNPSYARSIGKWILNLANASRLFYADEHPRNRQTSAVWAEDPGHVICYEGVRKDLDHGNKFQVFKGVLSDEGPYAVGDQVKILNARTDICPYGSAWVGFLASIVDTTNIEGILKLDCNATDFFGSRKYPSYLYFNPHKESRTIIIDAGSAPVRMYDLVSKKMIAENKQQSEVEISGSSAMMIVLIPVSAVITKKGNQLLADGSVIDYQIN